MHLQTVGDAQIFTLMESHHHPNLGRSSEQLRDARLCLQTAGVGFSIYRASRLVVGHKVSVALAWSRVASSCEALLQVKFITT